MTRASTGSPSIVRRLPSLVAAAALALIAAAATLPTVGAVPDLKRLRAGAARLEALPDPAAAPLDEVLDRADEISRILSRCGRERLGWTGEVFARDTVRSAETAYLAAVRRHVIEPAHARLAAQIGRDGDWLERRDALAAYLMLGGRGPIDQRAFDLLAARAAEVTAARSGKGERDLHAWIQRHVEGYVARLRTGAAPPLPVDEALAGAARAALARAPIADRLESFALRPVASARCGMGLAYPPLSLDRLFADRPDALRAFASKHAGAAPAIDGPFTAAGHAAILARMARAGADFAENRWVLPLGPDDEGDALTAHLTAFHQSYAARQARQWEALLEDLAVAEPASPGEVAGVLTALARPEWPYLRILRNLDQAVERPDPAALPLTSCEDPRRGAGADARRKQIEAAAWWADLARRSPPPAPAPLVGMAALIQPPAGDHGNTPLARWVAGVAALRDAVSAGAAEKVLRDRIAAARAATEADLAHLDAATRRVWGPLLLDPIALVAPR